MADLEVTVVHLVVVIEIGQRLHQGPAGDSVAANGIEGSLDRRGERLLEGFFEQRHLSLEITGFIGIEGRVKGPQLAERIGLADREGEAEFLLGGAVPDFGGEHIEDLHHLLVVFARKLRGGLSFGALQAAKYLGYISGLGLSLLIE